MNEVKVVPRRKARGDGLVREIHVDEEEEKINEESSNDIINFNQAISETKDQFV